jgi:type III secretory pathway lipoprotein EscJ
MTPQEQQPDIVTMLYMIKTLEQQLQHVQDQLKSFVPIRENDIQLQNVQATVSRIERDVIAMKSKQETMEKEARDAVEKQRASQAALQIRFLLGFASVVVTIVGGVVTGFITHLF